MLYVISLGFSEKPQKLSTKSLKPDSNLIKNRGPETRLSLSAPHCSVRLLDNSQNINEIKSKIKQWN